MYWFWRAVIAAVSGTLAGGGCYAVQDFMLIAPSVRPPGVAPSWLPVAIVSSIVALTTFVKLIKPRPEWLEAPETRCRKCGYMLRGISEPRCPECGERI